MLGRGGGVVEWWSSSEREGTNSQFGSAMFLEGAI